MADKKFFRFAVLMIAILTMVQVCLIYIPQEAEAIGNPICTITIDQPSQTAQVAPGQDGIVTFTGSVNCQLMVNTGIEQVLVSLTAEAQGWVTSLTPSTMAFTKQETDIPFTCAVKVPPRTSHQLSGEVTISGRARVIPGKPLYTNIDPVKAAIYVKQFYKFQVECSKPFLEISPGDMFSFQLKIRNVGNDQDTIMINLDPKVEKALIDLGWAIQFSQTQYIIDEGADQVVKISITPAQEWNVWKNKVQTIKLKIFSYQAMSLGEIPVESTYPLYVRERGWSTPGFEAYIVYAAFIVAAFMLAGIAGMSARRVTRMQYKKK